MHINGDFTWRAITDHKAVEYPLIAQGFKLIQHAHGKRMYIDNMVAGSHQLTGMPSYIMWTSAQFQTT